MKRLLILLFMLIASPCYAATDYTADANCMGAWAMSTSNGDETDLSGEGETLTQSGTILTSVTVPAGYDGTSRDFERGSSEFLEHADGGSTDISGADQNISLCAWFKMESMNSGNCIQQKFRTSQTNGQYRFYVDDTTTGVSGRVGLVLSSNGTSSTGLVYSANDSIVPDTWYHACGVYDEADTGSELRMYVDGSSVATVNYTAGIYNGGAPFRIGALGDSGWTGNYFDGLLDEVIIFDKAISSSDVTSIYTYGIDGRLDTTGITPEDEINIYGQIEATGDIIFN